jgi:hypothetical protein
LQQLIPSPEILRGLRILGQFVGGKDVPLVAGCFNEDKVHVLIPPRFGTLLLIV